MRTVLVIGVGAGDPDQITIQAIKAINRAEVVFVIEKGTDADELAQLRRELLNRYLEPWRQVRVVELADPPRDRTADEYGAAVQDWRDRRARTWGTAIGRELAPDGIGAFLVWGDPALYDSTIAVLEHIRAAAAPAIDYEVIPGISSVQALAARHRVAWNRIGGAVQITTGRRLAASIPQEADDVLVMLDGGCAFANVTEDGMEIYWGAYIGTEDEILVSGPLREVASEIERLRAEARARKGWVMDSYLLRRTPTQTPRRR